MLVKKYFFLFVMKYFHEIGVSVWQCSMVSQLTRISFCGSYADYGRCDTLNGVTTIEKQVYMVGALKKINVVSSIILIMVGIITLNSVTTIE